MNEYVKILIFGLFLSSCTSARVKYSTPVNENSNGVIEIRNPHYDRKVNVIGYVAMAGLTGGGAYAGYKNPFVKYNTKVEEVNSPEASAAVAGLAGLGIAITGNYILGKKDKLSYPKNKSNELKKWAKKYSSKYILIESMSTNSNLVLVNKKAEQYYVFNDMQDVDIFVEAFPNSDYNSLICAKSYRNLYYSKIPELLEKVNIKGSSVDKEIKLHYINSSQALSEYLSALRLYPNIKNNPSVDGIQYIESMDDVRTYSKYFKKIDENKLIDRAAKYATTFSNVKYFNQKFPHNSYYDRVLLDIIPSSSDKELEDLIILFPKSSSIDKIKEIYILRAESADTFIKRNSKYSFFKLRNQYSLTKIKDCKDFVTSVKKTNSIALEQKQKLIASASKDFLFEKYRNTTTTDKAQKTFITFIKENSWLSKREADNYIAKANNQIASNARIRYMFENELDDIDKYVYIKTIEYEDADGEKLGFFDQLLSTSAERINKKLFLKVHLTNEGNLKKKVKVTAYLNMVEETKALLENSRNSSKIKKEYILEIPPNTTSKEMIVEYDYQVRFKDEYIPVWGQNYFYYGPDRELEKEGELFDFELEYYDSSVPDYQEFLRQEVSDSYKNRKRGTNSGSRYMVNSNTHEVLEDTQCYVDVKRLTDNSESNGCLSIYSDDVSSAYYSSITTYNGKKSSYSNKDDDNFTDCFEYSDFPLVVSVSYIKKNGKQVKSRVRLESFYDYEINIK